MHTVTLLDFHPPIDPFQKGSLAVGDGHRLYFEVSGNPDGRPVVFLHGGPGAGTQPIFRRFFDPERWKIILFDQRGCGLSTPSADIRANTTQDLIADMEKLRTHLNVPSWLLFGGSWGSTLALAYGQAFPERVTGFILRGVFLFRPREVDWFLTGMGHFFPEAWQRFTGFLPAPERGDLLSAYSARLNHPDPAVHFPAALSWYAYEEACARLLPRIPAIPPDETSALAMARIECHYMVNGGFMAPDQLLLDMPKIAHLPGIIVQGRYDVICPPCSASDLARSWPGSQLNMIPDAGHSALETGTKHALILALHTLLGRQQYYKS